MSDPHKQTRIKILKETAREFLQAHDDLNGEPWPPMAVYAFLMAKAQKIEWGDKPVTAMSLGLSDKQFEGLMNFTKEL